MCESFATDFDEQGNVSPVWAEGAEDLPGTPPVEPVWGSEPPEHPDLHEG
jgi:hypothetical protein